MYNKYEGISQVLLNEIEAEFKIYIHLDTLGFKIKRGDHIQIYNNNLLNSVITEFLNKNLEFKVLNKDLKEVKILPLRDNKYRLLYPFDDRKSLCLQEKYTYFGNLEDKNFKLKKYSNIGMFSYSSHETTDIFNKNIITFTI